MSKLIALTLLLVACGGSEAPTTAPAPAPAPAALPETKAPAPTDAAPAGDATADAAKADAAGGNSDGEQVYTQYCIACHQADGKGMNGTLAGDFTSGRLADKTDDELLASIRDGYTGKVGAMPAWKGVLTDEQMKAALDYVKTKYHPQG